MLRNPHTLMCTKNQKVCKVNTNKVLNICKSWVPKLLNAYRKLTSDYNQTIVDDGKVLQVDTKCTLGH
jgi:hypothetical protein